MFQRRGHEYKLESQVNGTPWGLECRLVGPVFLLQGVRVWTQQKLYHPAIPRVGWGGGGVIGRQLDDVLFILCHGGKIPNKSNLREKGFILSHPWLELGQSVMVQKVWSQGQLVAGAVVVA